MGLLLWTPLDCHFLQIEEEDVFLPAVRDGDSTPPPPGSDVRYGWGAVVNNERKTERSLSLVFMATGTVELGPNSETKRDSGPLALGVGLFITVSSARNALVQAHAGTCGRARASIFRWEDFSLRSQSAPEGKLLQRLGDSSWQLVTVPRVPSLSCAV